jgi:hypothetical protein
LIPSSAYFFVAFVWTSRFCRYYEVESSGENNQNCRAYIGAGPTGLSLACQFVRYGIDFVIIERNESITPYSKAIGVQARTLEIYEQIGLAQRAVEEGTIAMRGTSGYFCASRSLMYLIHSF